MRNKDMAVGDGEQESWKMISANSKHILIFKMSFCVCVNLFFHIVICCWMMILAHSHLQPCCYSSVLKQCIQYIYYQNGRVSVKKLNNSFLSKCVYDPFKITVDRILKHHSPIVAKKTIRRWNIQNQGKHLYRVSQNTVCTLFFNYWIFYVNEI